jgi:hypothetical protein
MNNPFEMYIDQMLLYKIMVMAQQFCNQNCFYCGFFNITFCKLSIMNSRISYVCILPPLLTPLSVQWQSFMYKNGNT